MDLQWNVLGPNSLLGEERTAAASVTTFALAAAASISNEYIAVKK